MFSYPPGISLQDIKGCGTSGIAALVPNTKEILKFSLGDEDECARCDHERRIYQLFELSSYQRPKSLLRFLGSTNYGILLEFAELGPVRQYLHGLRHPPQESICLRWAYQAAEALHFVHINGVCHGDINCNNFFLDGHLDLKLGDFTSSSIHPHIPQQALQEDMFEFGSALYEMATGHPPYPDLSTTEREETLLAKKYPDLTKITTLKSIIHRCWNAEYNNMEDIMKDIEKTRKFYFPFKALDTNLNL